LKCGDDMPVGKPLKYKNVDVMSEIIDNYFIECDKKGKPYTVTGLACALNMTRDQILNYQGKREYADTLLRAKQKVAAYAEERLFDRDGARGAEFSLKCNYRWRDNEGENLEIAIKKLDEVLGKIGGKI